MAMLMAVLDLNNEAIMAVIVVPRFAPIINGKTLGSKIFPVAARGTINDVVMELDCNPPVNRNPQLKDFKGLLKMYLFNFSLESPITDL